MIAGIWLVVAALLSGAGSLYVMARLWRYREKPGAEWFLLTLGCQAGWCVSYAVALLAFDPLVRFVLEAVGWGLLGGIGVYFLAFALAYTGRGHVVRTPWYRGLLALPVVAVLVALTNPLHGLVWTDFAVVEVAGVAGVTYDLSLWWLVLATAVASLALLGSFVLFDTVFSYGPLYRREAIAVGVSTVPPLVALFVWLYDLGPVPALNLVPFLFVPHVALDAYAFVGSDMFEFHPATRREGERAAIEDLGNPVVVVDEQNRVVTLNAAAEETLGVTKAEALTEPLGDFLADDFDGAVETDRAMIEHGSRRRTYSLAATPLESGGERLGSTIVLQDITEEIQREQRLQVLNRVVRHNLRNDMTVVQGFTETANNEIEDGEVSDMLDTVERKADELISLGEKARDIEEVLASDRSETSVDLPRLLDDVVETVAPERPVEIQCPDLTVTTDADTLRVLCVALVENAVEHGVSGAGEVGQTVAADGDAPVRVSVARAENGVTITVADDGPGIPEHELAVLSSGEETDLEHSTGLGLWLATWATRRLGGDLRFETDEGTTARLWLPADRGDSAAT